MNALKTSSEEIREENKVGGDNDYRKEAIIEKFGKI